MLISWWRLFLIAVVAAMFGAGAGYIGGTFAKESAKATGAVAMPANEEGSLEWLERVLERRKEEELRQSLEERLGCISAKVEGEWRAGCW